LLVAGRTQHRDHVLKARRNQCAIPIRTDTANIGTFGGIERRTNPHTSGELITNVFLRFFTGFHDPNGRNIGTESAADANKKLYSVRKLNRDLSFPFGM
jgi:hypothetical protein